jgi:hypothetical protein
MSLISYKVVMFEVLQRRFDQPIGISIIWFEPPIHWFGEFDIMERAIVSNYVLA